LIFGLAAIAESAVPDRISRLQPTTR